MNKVHTFKRALSLLTACMIPLTGMLSSAPLTAKAADNYIYSDTTQTSLSTHKNKSEKATLPDRSIAREDKVSISEVDHVKGRTLDYTYTGNIYTANSSLYDYVSDNEGNSFAENYTDPYVTLNRAIESTMNYRELYSPSSENVTIVFESTNNGDKDVKVYLFNDSKDNVWDGAAMVKIPSSEKHIYTVKYDDLGFKPTGLKIRGRNSSSQFWETGAIAVNLEKGKSYYCYNGSINATGAAEDLYKTSIPLYFGCFYREYNGTDISHNYGSYNKGDGTPDGKAHNNYYSNFYWQANMSFRRNYDGAVQGLVDDTLTDGTITQNGIKMPYFNDEWADAHSNLVKYWHDIDFPFYEVSIDADKVHSANGGNPTGKAIYYQFNSRKDNLFFDQSKGKYKETDTQIKSQGTILRDENGNQTASNVRTVSYLPFNDKDSTNGTNNNLGFGTTFDIKFRIRNDGKVDTVDGNGSVNATFEFMGDDDVWVFIDDKLVLDLGGDHKDTTGIIDFAEKKAYANDVTGLGYNSNTNVYVGMDNLSKDLTKQLTVNLADVMAEGTFNSDGSYNESMTHTLRMFYMERGMFESDLFVRFNFSTIPNNNTLKIKEVTQFKDINAGLLDLTKKAADYDVFDYSISNSGTSADDVGESGIVSPTYNYYQRDNLDQKALLSGKDLEYDVVYDEDSIYLDTSKKLSGGYTWDDNTVLAAWIWKDGDDSSGRLYLAQQVDEHLYKFNGFSSAANKVIFCRLHADKTYTDGSSSWPGDDNVYDRAELGFEKSYTYIVNDWKNNISKGSKATKQIVHYEERDFDPTQGDAVKNVNYNWIDEMASVISGTDTNGLVGTTDNAGSFRLMYGTDASESSAEFLKQFKKGSQMTVNQLDSLKTVTRGTTPETFGTTLSRSVSEYYDTTVTVVDKGGNTILSGAMTDTDYAYQNTASVDSKEPVQITETFVNTPKVGAITVTKKLNPNDNVTDDFVFTIRLYDVFGVTGKDELTVTDYSAITANKTLTTVDTVIEGKSVKAGQFTLKRDETLTIQGVPYGTKYTVMETAVTEKYEQQSTTADGEQTVYEGTFDDTHTNITPAAQNQETVVNTRLTNSLTLSKTLSGDYSKTTVNDSTPFAFEVTLTAPTGVDLSMYTFTTTPSGIAIADKNSFTVNVSVNQAVTISGIPYGTQYTVKETTKMENWSNDGIRTGEIGETASAATIGNTYTPPAPELGSLTVSKNVVNFTGSDEIPDSDKALQFSFTVTLKDKSGTLLTGTVSYPATGIPTGTKLDFVDGVATFQLSDDDSVTISDIPAGYRYEVTEADMAGFEKIVPANATGTIVKDQTVTAAFTNQKIFQPYELPAAGFEDTRLTWILLMAGMTMFGLLYWYVNRKTMTKE